jgi:hypothetical protein
MKLDKNAAVALIAGIALYQLLGPYVEYIRGLVDCLVITEFLARAFRLDEFFKP